METAIVIRNGEVKARVPNVTEKNSRLWAGKNILINSALIPTGQKNWVKAQIRDGKITPEIEDMGMVWGDNGNGLIVKTGSEYDAEQQAKAKAEYDALPADVKASSEERRAIEALFMAAEKSLLYDTDDNYIMRGHRQLAEAKRRLAKWRQDYPDAAKKEDAENLRLQADKNVD